MHAVGARLARDREITLAPLDPSTAMVALLRSRATSELQMAEAKVLVPTPQLLWNLVNNLPLVLTDSI